MTTWGDTRVSQRPWEVHLHPSMPPSACFRQQEKGTHMRKITAVLLPTAKVGNQPFYPSVRDGPSAVRIFTVPTSQTTHPEPQCSLANSCAFQVLSNGVCPPSLSVRTQAHVPPTCS